MRKLILFSVLIFVMQNAFTQTPERMSYQAVIRNSNGLLVTTMPVGMRISILEGSVAGFPVYVETQTPVSNANGLISIEIGNGTIVSGDFALIDWANGLFFLKTETDPSGGTNYSIVGTSQLLSVPYAFHAKTAESLTIPPTESDPVFNSSVASGISNADTTNWNNKLDSYTESDPVFSISVASGINTADTSSWNNKLDSYTETDPVFSISVAGGINAADTSSWNNKLDSYTESDPVFNSSVASGISNADTTNWNNKLDSYTETDPVFNSSVASSISPADTSNWNSKLDYEVDGSVTNELQALSISNDTIYLVNGGFVKLPTGFSGDYNDLTNKPEFLTWDTIAADDFDGQYSSLTGVPTNISSFNNDAGYITGYNELDGDSTNELQEISISNDTISLTSGGFAVLPSGFSGDYNYLINTPDISSLIDSILQSSSNNFFNFITDTSFASNAGTFYIIDTIKHYNEVWSFSIVQNVVTSSFNYGKSLTISFLDGSQAGDINFPVNSYYSYYDGGIQYYGTSTEFTPKYMEISKDSPIYISMGDNHRFHGFGKVFWNKPKGTIIKIKIEANQNGANGLWRLKILN